MRRPIGYYVHHRGDGHRQRALAIAQQAGDQITLLGTGLRGRCPGVTVIELPDDRVVGDAFMHHDGAARPGVLHYAPLGHAGIRRRVARIADWIAEAQPALMVVDVSVEVALLARLASTPTVYVRLSGDRSDPPHMEAYRSAVALLAPFHEALDDVATPDVTRRKTFYASGLLTPPATCAPADDLVLGVVGDGGGLDDTALWAAAAHATPNMRWQVAGRCRPIADLPPNLALLGWVDDVVDRIARAGVVVGAAGDGVVGAVIAAGRPYVCIPQDRPFAEQHRKAERLAALGAAVVRSAWPDSQDWPAVLGRARRLDPDALRRLTVEDGAKRATAWLADIAAQVSGSPL